MADRQGLEMMVLDLFCGAGGAGMGYSQAGFDVVGVDCKPQPHYPFEFHQCDALEFCRAYGHTFDLIHASPPCQAYSESTPIVSRGNHPMLIEPTRLLLQETGRPYVIENVENARHHLINPVMICGSMLGLGVWRHRYFEIHPHTELFLPHCDHTRRPFPMTPPGSNSRKAGNNRNMSLAESKCGIAWMNGRELSQAIPPAYTRSIGSAILKAIADFERNAK